MLSGKTHEVLTGVAVTPTPNESPLFLMQISEVEFAPLSDEQIQTYIDSGEPFGKAGAYGIQGGAAPLFPKSAVVIAVSWVFLYTKLLNS